MASKYNSFKLEDYTDKVTKALQSAAVAWLHEAAGELEAQVKRNTAVDTGQLKGSWRYVVDEKARQAVVGSPLENAIWEEFGTGEYALNGDGRKGGWKYKDAKGAWHFTRGKKPRRAFYLAYTRLKPRLIKRAQQIFKGKLS